MAIPTRMNSLTTYQADPLWQRLDAFSLDDADAPFPFSAKLAKENNWNTSFAKAAILEYKRFVYLCCTLPQGASPPPIVDEVWHLHLCYTINYWEVFCETVLQRKLHHHPNKGGAVENERHHNWLDDTLTNYRNIFGTEPPEPIWKSDVESKANVGMRSTGTRKWLILTAAVAVCLALSGCSSAATGLGIISLVIIVAGLSGTASTVKKGDGSTGGCSSGGGCSSNNGCSGGGGCSGGDGGGGGCGGGCGGCGGGGD